MGPLGWLKDAGKGGRVLAVERIEIELLHAQRAEEQRRELRGGNKRGVRAAGKLSAGD